MIFESIIISRGSGSIGGLTASHNKGGNYFRARVTPVDPGTVFQTAVRLAAATLVNAWNNILTQIQRTAWDVYALNTPLLNPFGAAKTVTGLNMYVRGNVPRIQAGLIRIDAAPTIFNLGEFTLTAGVASAAIQQLSLGFFSGDPWAAEPQSAMLVYISRPQNVSINFFKGPYRFAGSVLGDVAPPTTPQLFDVPFPIVAGQRLFWQLRVTRADARLSTIQRDSQLVIA